MKWKSGPITSVQCIPFTTEWGNLFQTFQDARKIGALAGHPNGVSLKGR